MPRIILARRDDPPHGRLILPSTMGLTCELSRWAGAIGTKLFQK